MEQLGTTFAHLEGKYKSLKYQATQNVLSLRMKTGEEKNQRSKLTRMVGHQKRKREEEAPAIHSYKYLRKVSRAFIFP